MMSTTGVLCLVAALVSTVSCYTCPKCETKNGKICCSDSTVECPHGCATFSEQCVVNNRPVSSIKKNCAPQGLNKTVTLVFNNDDGQILEQLNVAVCKEDNCNEKTIFRYDPNALGRPNGLYCESCSRENSKAKECNSRDRVACRGNQRQCLSLSGTFKRGDGTILVYVFKGCISDLGCILKYKYLVGTTVLKEISFQCTNASTNARDCSGCGGNSYY